MVLRPWMFDRQRQLVISAEYVSFDDQDRASAPPTRFEKATIQAVRCGVKAIRGYRFRIGRIYCIDVQDNKGQVIRIRLKSLYRVRVKQLEEKYVTIINALFQHHFDDIAAQYFRRFRRNEEVELLGVNLNRHGVLFDPRIGRVSWEYLRTKRYWHYFTLFSEETPDHYRAFVFLEEWNSALLLGMIEAIRAEKFPGK